jgi:hypothetical protein
MKFCSWSGKLNTLTKILEYFPNLSQDGTAFSKEFPEEEKEDEQFIQILKSSQKFDKKLEQLMENEGSVLSIAISNGHISIVKLILEESNYELVKDVAPET